MRCATSLAGWAVLLALAAGCQRELPPAAPTSMPVTNQVRGGTNALDDAPRFSALPLTNLPTLKLYVGPHEVSAQLALKPHEMATGMMHRTAIDPEEAMLFALPRPMQASFYNRNVHFDLGVAYLDPEGVIAEIVTLKKEDPTPVPSKANNIQFVLEVAPDWFQRKGVGVGTLVVTPRGPLRQAFVFN